MIPTEKVEALEAEREGGIVVMVGDGLNDAPALAAADVGVAMGARGATASSEAADVVLVADRLDGLVEAIAIARRSRAIAIQSVLLGMGLAFAFMFGGAFGLFSPVAGALIQELIDVASILNALRALSGGYPALGGRPRDHRCGGAVPRGAPRVRAGARRGSGRWRTDSGSSRRMRSAGSSRRSAGSWSSDCRSTRKRRRPRSTRWSLG